MPKEQANTGAGPGTGAVRLDKRVAELSGCSRGEAGQYIEGGWVRVDGLVVELPQYKIRDQSVVLDPKAQLAPAEPATILLHKPAGIDSGEGPHPALALVRPETRTAEDDPAIRVLQRHFKHLTPIFPLESEASGLLVFTQDGRLLRRIKDDAERIEQEFVVEVSGEIAPNGLTRLCHGLSFQGRKLPPAKVSWQNETRLRFALKGVQAGQIRHMCAAVGLQVLSLKRIRLGRIPLSQMPVGTWRYLPAGERF